MKSKLVALWVYQGNSFNGQDVARKGELELAKIAHAYYKRVENGMRDDGLVEPIAPSKVGCKVDKSQFGQTYAYRIIDENKLREWREQFN